MKKDNAKKMGSFDYKSLADLKREQNAYIPGFVLNKNNYKIPANDFMDKVYHDDTLVGDGTPAYPLSVVGGSGSSASGCNINIDSPQNTIIVRESPNNNFHLEGTNWAIRYSVSYDQVVYDTLYPIDGEIETEIIHDTPSDPALKFILNDSTNKIVTTFTLNKLENSNAVNLAQFTGSFTYNFDPALYDSYYALNVQSNGYNSQTPGINIFTGVSEIGQQPEELVFKSDFDALVARIDALEGKVHVTSDVVFDGDSVVFNNIPLTYETVEIPNEMQYNEKTLEFNGKTLNYSVVTE